MKAKSKKTPEIFWIKRLIIFLIISVIICITLPFSQKIEKRIGIGHTFATDVSKYNFNIHSVDVGQGDCTIIEFSNGDKALIDSGYYSSNANLREYLKNVIFKGSKNWKFDYVIATHSDSDHVGNMEYILSNSEVKNVYRPDIYLESESLPTGKLVDDNLSYEAFINAAKIEENCNIITITDGLTIVPKDADPGEEIYKFSFFMSDENYSDVNDYSPLIIVESSGTKVAFTGDASTDAEMDILANHSSFLTEIGGVDIFNVGHHGSKYSNSESLLTVLHPEYAFIGVGKDNTYGHPTNEVYERLNSVGVSNDNIYRTDRHYNTIFSVNLDGVIIIIHGRLTESDSVKWWMLVCTFIALVASITLVPRYRRKR